MAKKKIIFRGASINSVDLRVSANDNSGIHARLRIRCDFTKGVASAMGWEDLFASEHLASGMRSVKLDGELNLERVELKVNGIGGKHLECGAVRAWDFELSKTKGETEGSYETSLWFKMTSTDWKTISGFFGNMGKADGALSAFCAPEQEANQQLLTEDPEGDEA